MAWQFDHRVDWDRPLVPDASGGVAMEGLPPSVRQWALRCVRRDDLPTETGGTVGTLAGWDHVEHNGHRFARIASTRGHEEVAAQIREAILSERLQPMERLPASRQMAEQFGVSRATINEALRVLEHSGLVVTKRGAHGGTFVRKPTPDQVIREMGVLIRAGGIGLTELTEIRELLEGQNAAWAATRATEDDLAELRQIADRMRALATSDEPRRPGEVEELDVELHTAIAHAAHNELSAAIVMGIVPAIREMIGLLPPHVEADAAEQYEAIWEAIASRNAKRAREAMARHVGFFAGVLGRRVPK